MQCGSYRPPAGDTPKVASIPSSTINTLRQGELIHMGLPSPVSLQVNAFPEHMCVSLVMPTITKAGGKSCSAVVWANINNSFHNVRYMIMMTMMVMISLIVVVMIMVMMTMMK